MGRTVIALAMVVAVTGACGAGMDDLEQPVGAHEEALRGGKKNQPPSGSCTVTPGSIAVGQSATVTGSGFMPNNSVGFYIQGACTSIGCATAVGGTTSDANGNVALDIQGVFQGTNTVSLQQVFPDRTHYNLMCTFQVN